MNKCIFNIVQFSIYIIWQVSYLSGGSVMTQASGLFWLMVGWELVWMPTDLIVSSEKQHFSVFSPLSLVDPLFRPLRLLAKQLRRLSKWQKRKVLWCRRSCGPRLCWRSSRVPRRSWRARWEITSDNVDISLWGTFDAACPLSLLLSLKNWGTKILSSMKIWELLKSSCAQRQPGRRVCVRKCKFALFYSCDLCKLAVFCDFIYCICLFEQLLTLLDFFSARPWRKPTLQRHTRCSSWRRRTRRWPSSSTTVTRAKVSWARWITLSSFHMLHRALDIFCVVWWA